MYRILKIWRTPKTESQSDGIEISDTQNDTENGYTEAIPKVGPAHTKYELSMWEAISGTIVVGLYAVARLYLLVEVFLGLWSMPESAYTSVQWSDFFPHV